MLQAGFLLQILFDIPFSNKKRARSLERAANVIRILKTTGVEAKIRLFQIFGFERAGGVIQKYFLEQQTVLSLSTVGLRLH